jgi:FtsP/CotA-like multicopper oxidase with cupredoxin domain
MMTFAGSPGEWPECSGLAALAILHYGAAPVDQNRVPDYEAAVAVPGRHLNPCPALPVPEQQTAVPVSALRARHPLENPQPADRTFYFLLGDGAHGANINMVQFPLDALEVGQPLLAEDPTSDGSFCSSSYTEDGVLCDPATDPTGCFCTHRLEVGLGDVVEIFLINPENPRPVAHPIHLHGQHYSVLGEGAVPNDQPMHWVREQNNAGAIPRNLDRPPHKDSVQTRPGHYILIRFLADNPGYWLLHCHISFDLLEGQGAVFKVGEREDWNIPADFNTNCEA